MSIKNWPDVTIVMTTWHTTPQRVVVARDALLSWFLRLNYSGELFLHVADDGSTLEFEPEKIWNKARITYSRQERKGVGASLNAGFKKAFECSPFIFYAVDDWILEKNFELDPWVQLLLEREDIGEVRLGPPHPHLRGTIEPMTENWQGWALRLDRFGLCIGHRPMLWHKRMSDYYGDYEEGVNACEVERLYTVKWAADPKGPDIVYALPHPWFHYHLDVLPSTSEIEPGKEY